MPEIQEAVAKALFNKGVGLSRQGEHEAEIKVYDELVERYGDNAESVVQVHIAKALVNKGITLWRKGEHEAEIEVYDQLVDRYEESEVREVQEQVTKGLFSKVRALITQGDYSTAMNSFRAVYTGFTLADEVMMRQIPAVVIELATTEAQQRDVLEILLMDDDKSAKLQPLVVALSKELGEQVRAPAEVMEVAEDIIKEIERRRASGP